MSDDLFELGMKTRREVLGDKHVDRSLEETDEFVLTMQRFATEWCWGAVWARDGLPRKTRCLLNVAMLTALNRSNELEGHMRGAVRNGATREEIQEVLLQAAVYCGLPAAGEASRIAKKVFSGPPQG
jgi:4-carboxymuconolactone decarboxylase